MAAGEEYVVVGYNTPIVITGINIYETLCCGSVIKIEKRLRQTNANSLSNIVKQKEGEQWKTIWEGPYRRDLPQEARIFSPTVLYTPEFSNEIKITLNTTANPTYTEIDAISLKYNTERDEVINIVERIDDIEVSVVP